MIKYSLFKKVLIHREKNENAKIYKNYLVELEELVIKYSRM
jgi:hypothetical protein